MAMPLVPVLQRARLREQAGLPCRPMRGGAAQVDALRRIDRKRGGVGGEPRSAIAQAKEGGRARPAAEFRALHDMQRLVVVREGAAIAIQHDHAGPQPQRVQCIGIVTQVVGAIQRAIDKGKGRVAPAHIVNDEPQPQVVFAFGLRITNCAPLSDSL